MARKAPVARTTSRRAFLRAGGAAGVASVAGCSGLTQQTDDNGGGLSGEVVVKGSSTVFPISDDMAERFMDDHPDVNVTVDPTGTGGGFNNHFCPGDAAINGASRPITESERETCLDNGVTPVEFQIGGDALTVAVNNDAEWVDCVTFDELSQIWRTDGAETWSDVREAWPDEPFELFGPASTSGTYDWFNEHVVGETAHTSDHEPTEEDNLIVRGIRGSPHAMGYFGFAYYNENSEQVKALQVKEEVGDECSSPGLENAKDGTYPMARPLYIYASEEAVQRDPVYEFLTFYLEQAETDTVREVGYVPSSAETRDDNLETLESLRE